MSPGASGRGKVVVGIACFLGALGAAGVARGEAPKEKEVLIATLKSRAKEAMEKDQLQESYDALKALQAIDPSETSTICNLGLIARRLKLYVEASENLLLCVKKTCSPPPPDKFKAARCEEMRAEVDMARAKVAVLVVRAPKGAPVTVDQRPIGASIGGVDPEREFFVEPGWREIGVGDQRRRVFLSAGSRTPFHVAPPAPKLPAPTPKPALLDAISIGGIVGTGLALTAGGMLLEVSTIKEEEAKEELGRVTSQTTQGCRDTSKNPVHCATFVEAQRAAEIYEVASIASFAGGIALGVATGAYVLHRTFKVRVVVGVGSAGVVIPW
jgi:hypothetical protein